MKDKNEIRHIKREAASLKSQLIRLEGRMSKAGMSQREQEKFARIVARLEEWCGSDKT